MPINLNKIKIWIIIINININQYMKIFLSDISPFYSFEILINQSYSILMRRKQHCFYLYIFNDKK